MLGTRLRDTITIISHIKTFHQNLPKHGLIASKFKRRRLKDFECDPDVAGGNIENRIGRNPTDYIKRSAHFLINAATLKEIRWKNPYLRKFKEATVVDSEVLIVGCVIQNSRI